MIVSHVKFPIDYGKHERRGRMGKTEEKERIMKKKRGGEERR
jgi:hypothetical protein